MERLFDWRGSLLVLRRILRHQYNVQLKRRTQQVQEELVSARIVAGFPLQAVSTA